MATRVQIKTFTALNLSSSIPPISTDIEQVINDFLAMLTIGDVLHVSVIPYSQYGGQTVYLGVVTYKTNV